MRTTDFHRLVGQAGRLSRRQRDVFSRRLAASTVVQAEHASGVVAVLNERVAEKPTCPRCGSAKVQRWGKVEGVQRLRCCSCTRTFNPLTGTPLARLRKRELWLDYAKALEDGLSIRGAGRRLGVHYNTTFRWRHRWLDYLRERKAARLSGIVEADAAVFRECRKERHGWTRVAIDREVHRRRLGGDAKPARTPTRPALAVAVLFARDRNGATTDAILPAFTVPAVRAVLEPLVDARNVVLCTDGAAVYRAVCRRGRIAHRSAGDQHRPASDGAFHIRNVGGYRNRLEIWMRRFNGVSTRYLANYLGWRRLLDQSADGVAPTRWLRLALTPPGARAEPTPNGGSIERMVAKA